MPAFLASIRDLCLFRHGPEDMPYSPRLLIALLVGCAVLLVAFDLHAGAKAGLIAGSIVGGLADVGLVLLLLRGQGKRERFVQTATALAVVCLLFDLAKFVLTVALPVQTWRQHLLAHPGQLPALTGVQTALVLIVSVLWFWRLCVWTGTLRRSLEIPLVGAVLVLMGLFFANMFVMVVVAGALGVA